MSEKDLISIIIPSYNSESYIEKCLKSVCAQTYENIEIIVIDDGSTDKTVDIVRNMAEEDHRIIIISQSNAGSTVARNNGLDRAKGNYICFADSDDWIEPDMVEALYLGCTKNNAQICVGRHFADLGGGSHIDAGRSIMSGVITKESGEMPHHIIYSDDYSKRGVSPNLWDKIFAADIIKTHQRIVDVNTKFAEDDLCVYSALLDADRVAFIDKPIYHYCVRDGSVTRSGDKTYFEKISLFYRQMAAVFKKQESSELLMKKLDRYMVEFILRGVNRSFGFDFGVVLPYFIPPYKKLKECNASKILLYGAGNVGREYYAGLIRSGYDVVAWADKRGKELSNQGLNVICPDAIRDLQYDAILIAAEGEDLMKQVKTMLIDEIGVPSEKIIDEYPVKFIQTLG